VFAVADAEGLERFPIWGQSYGGRIAWMAAAAAPERVAAIVTSGFWDPRPLPEEPAEIDGWDEGGVRRERPHGPHRPRVPRPLVPVVI
jgi:pimeloyl-ACP methyl ester carboxylesterase